MKKILFVIPTMRMGGAEKALVSLLKSLSPETVQVDLFLFEQGGVLQEQLPDWVNVLPENVVTRGMLLEFRYHWLSLVRTGHLIAACRRLQRYLLPRIRKTLHLRERFDWAKTAKAIPPLAGSYDVAIGFLEGVTDFFVIDKVSAKRKIGWIHNDFSGRHLFPEEKKKYEAFDALATISELCRQAFLKSLPEVENRMSVIENIACKDEIRSAADQQIDIPWAKEIPQLLTVGRLEYQKGIDIAVQASHLLKQRGVAHQWHVFGIGSLQKEIEALIAAHHLEDCFYLEGLKSNPYPYMKRADLIVQTSRWEGKSIVIDEAKILGKPIVVTNYPSVADQIQDGVTGVVTELSPEGIADGIQMLLKTPYLQNSLCKNCLYASEHEQEALTKFYQLLEDDPSKT